MSDAKGSRAGSMFGPYHLKRVLGQGGMGAVYEAEHTVKGWTVAVKLMSEALSQDPVFRERMKREARHTGRLQEPHVVPIHDYGEIDGQMFLEMRLIEGIDLDSMLKKSGPLTPPRAVAIITQIASALDAAHAAGVMHRDVKPQNILVTREDFAYLVDFGIASATTDEKITQLGTAVGTWKYMAPERFSTGEVTHRADIYALACVLYECLTGAPPYASDSAGVLVTSHMMDPVPQPSTKRSGIPRSIDKVIARGMAKRPDERYATAGELARAAHQALTNPDQDQAEDILRRSTESTMPHKAVAPQSVPYPPAGYVVPANSGRTPPPTPTRPPTWASTSGPRPTPGPPVIPDCGFNRPRTGPSPGSPGGPLLGPPPGPPPGPPQAPPGVPQHFTGPAQWPQPLPRRGRNPWPIVAGVAALVVILVIGAVVVGKVVRNSGDRTVADTTTTSTATTTTTPYTTAPTTTRTTVSADLQRLLGALPRGYPTGTCTPDSRPMPGAVVSVKCGRNGDPDGPTVAAYGLFPTVDSVQNAFTSFIKTFTIQNCPGAKASPGTWWHNKDPNTILGQIACGVYKDSEPQVMWSNQQTMVFALVGGSPQGPNLDQLYKWWASHS
jgi:serine/threonine kinase PknH